MKYLLMILSTILFLNTQSAIAAEERMMLVLDMSGSMWGQIDGKSKIEIAKDSVKALVKNSPDSFEIGIVAYGHRKKGDCADIETILPVRTIDKTEICKVIDGLNPRGMTPLSAAVRHAADELKFTEHKASVVLVSDGIENCGIDPCKLAQELAELGVDFKAHVIGFDVGSMDQKGLRCLAESTGGKYLTAENSKQLLDALNKVVATEASPSPSPSPSPEPKPEPLPEARLIAPETAIRGTEIGIEFDAPPGLDGYVYLHLQGKEKHISYTKVYEGKQSAYKKSEIRLPAETGVYELIWKSGKDVVYAKTSVTATEAKISLEVPLQATKGTEVAVKLNAPDGLDGYIYLYPHKKEDHISYAQVHAGKIEPYNTPTLRMPAQPGIYDLRWESGKKELLAEVSVEVVDAPIHITTVAEAPISTDIKVEINAPEGLSGYLYLFAKGKEKSITYSMVQENPTGGYKKNSLSLPAVAGEYTVKWLSGKDELLAETAVKALAAEIGISHNKEAIIGTELSITLNAPDGMDGYVYLFPEGKDKHLTYTMVQSDPVKSYKTLNLTLPGKAGNYVLKWINKYEETLATSQLTVLPATIKLSCSDNIRSGEDFNVLIDAPPGIGGYLILYKKGSDKKLAETLVHEGNQENYKPAKIKAPHVAGDYDIRWEARDSTIIAETSCKILSANAETEK